jgi:hypothetical protein
LGKRVRAYPESNSVKVFVLDHLEEILISYYRQTRALGADEILKRDGKLVYCDTSQTDLRDRLRTSQPSAMMRPNAHTVLISIQTVGFPVDVVLQAETQFQVEMLRSLGAEVDVEPG